MTYDKRLLNIINSCDLNYLDEIFKELKYEKVLTSDEIKLFDEYINHIETKGFVRLGCMISYEGELEKYDEKELHKEIDKFISERQNKQYEELLNSTTNDLFSNENIDLFFRGYTSKIKKNINKFALFDSDVIFNNFSEGIDISTANLEMDYNTNGFRYGTVNTIVGDQGITKSLWALNIAYDAIIKGKNVLYLSIGTSKERIAQRFLARHSHNTSKFEKSLPVDQFYNSNNSNLIERISLDFQENLSSKIVIFDNENLIIPSIKSIRRLLAEAHNFFLKETESGIDLIIVDDMTLLSLYNGKTITDSRSVVINEYYTFFKKFSTNVFGTGKECCVICTHSDTDGGVRAEKNEGNYKLDMIHQKIVTFSDSIFTIYGIPSRVTIPVKMKSVKSFLKEPMSRPTSINAKFRSWYIQNESKSEIEKKVLIDIQEEEIKSLKKENEKLYNDIEIKDEYMDALKKSKDFGMYVDPICDPGMLNFDVPIIPYNVEDDGLLIELEEKY